MSTRDVQTFYRYYPVAERDRNWGFFTTTVGESRLGPGTEYPPSGHPKGYDFSAKKGRILSNFQVIYISAGGGWFKSDITARTTINAGDVFLLFPGIWHSYAPQLETGWDEHWVGFDGAMARRLMRYNFFAPTKPVLQSGRENQLLGWFKELVGVTHSNDPALQQITAGITLRILAHLYSSQQSKLAGDDRDLQVIHTAVTRMRKAMATQISLAELARELNVSYSWFRRAFAHHTGLSPHQYLLDIRLAHARELLAGTSLAAKEIAVKVGFEDPHYFSRLFHRRVGLTPLAWRERAQRDH